MLLRLPHCSSLLRFPPISPPRRSDGGVFFLASGVWVNFNTANSGLSDNLVDSIQIDLQGISLWTTFTPNNSDLVSFQIQTIVIGPDGDKWFGTGQGLSRFDGTDWTTFTTNDGLPSNFVTAVTFDGNGSVWAGTFSKGLARRDGDTWVRIGTEDGLGHNSIRSLVVDARGDLWVGTWGGGVSVFDGQSWTVYTPENGLVNERVLAMDVDEDDRKWITTDFGVSVLTTPATRKPNFYRGDSNCDATVDLADAIVIFDHLFASGGEPCCHDAADSNDRGRLDISSGIHLLFFLFSGGGEPAAPGPFFCGPDPTTDDDLGCESPPACSGITG